MLRKVIYLLFALLVIGFLSLYFIRKTPYGLLDTEAAIALKLSPARELDLPVEEQRASMREMVKDVYKKVDILRIEDKKITVDSPAVTIPIRIYSNHQEKDLPILVYYHGGGWVVGDIETHDAICRKLAQASKILVVSVDYRLAPEHPYPIPLEDSYNALKWVQENAATIGGNPEKIAVGGDSAGGNLAAAVALKARDKSGPKISFQALIYPVTDLSKLTTTSYNNFAEGYFLTKASMELYIKRYTPDVTSRIEGYVSPLLAKNLANLPPALIITAGFDPLRDEGEQYGERLKAAGVPTTITRYEGTLHGFFGMDALGEDGEQSIQEVNNQLTKYFNL